MVEEMLATRGIVVSHATIRQCVLKFGQLANGDTARRRLLFSPPLYLLLWNCARKNAGKTKKQVQLNPGRWPSSDGYDVVVLGIGKCFSEPRYHASTCCGSFCEHAAAIHGVDPAADEAKNFEPVECAGDRRLADCQVLGETTDGLWLIGQVDGQRHRKLAKAEVRLLIPYAHQNGAAHMVQ